MLFLVWGLFAALQLQSGLSSLPANLHNDDAMRLVEVRDFLAGQGWFDLAQYRLDPPDGVVTHWSRLIDLPLALMIAATRPLLGARGAETFVLAAWPLGLLLPALAGTARIALRLADSRAAMLALVLAVATVPVMTHFRVGAIDHHNVQITLLIWTIALLIREPVAPRAAAGAAILCLVSIAIGLEMLPAIAVIGTGVALLWIWRGREVAPAAAAFGVGFAASGVALLVATIPPWRYGAATCDAFSIVHVVAALLGGLGLAALAAFLRPDSVQRRLAAAAGLAVLLGASVGIMFPSCLRDPYELGPRLTTLWLEHVLEARSFLSLAREAPEQLVPIYGFIVVGLAAAIVMLWRDRDAPRWPFVLTTSVLFALFAVALWEVRTAAMADLLAVPVLYAALVRLFPGGRTVVLGLTRPVMIGAFVLNQAMLVPIGEAAARGVEALTQQRRLPFAAEPETCGRPDDVAPLAELPEGLVLAFIDAGPNILMTTGHTILAAPYHRNIRGNNAMLDVFLGSPDEAQARLAGLGVDYVAFCAGAPEAFNYRQAAPDGLAARLARGLVPKFLIPMATAPTPVLVYRVIR
jgi:hypothetical protein